MVTYYSIYTTPVGEVLFAGGGTNLNAMWWTVYKHTPKIKPDWIENPEVFAHAIMQLTEYFAGDRTSFDIAMSCDGTDFQKRVWNEIRKIPYGTYISYKDIALAIGNPKAVRAVGTAVGSNPLSIFTPCHRVLTSNGVTSGYAGGIDAKIHLLTLEGIPVKL